MQQRRGLIAALGITIALLAGIFLVAATLMRPAPKTEVGVVVFVDSVSPEGARARMTGPSDPRTASPAGRPPGRAR